MGTKTRHATEGLTAGRAIGAVACLLCGCTICPSPYDYSGPVPQGSVTQNDFCARAGGNRPIGVTPPVWPEIVRREGGGGDRVARLPEVPPPLAEGPVTATYESEASEADAMPARPANPLRRAGRL